MTAPEYFDRLYAENADPWDLATSPYEQRKLALLLAALPRPRYAEAFEPGCAIGATTAALAGRCDRLLAMDGAGLAVAQARARLAERASHVTVVRGLVPADWPSGRFDLIVVSELLYYLDDGDRQRVATLAASSLAPGGDLVAVHWRHGFVEAATDGDRVHRELGDRLPEPAFERRVDHVEPDFRLEVYSRVDGWAGRPPPLLV